VFIYFTTLRKAKTAMNLVAVILEEFFAASFANSVTLNCDTLARRSYRSSKEILRKLRMTARQSLWSQTIPYGLKTIIGATYLFLWYHLQSHTGNNSKKSIIIKKCFQTCKLVELIKYTLNPFKDHLLHDFRG
jgi:hypothetical protein